MAGITGSEGAELLRAAADHESPRAKRGPEDWGGGWAAPARQALTSAHAWLSGAGPYSIVAKISGALRPVRAVAITGPGRFPRGTAGRSAQKNLEVRRAAPPPPAQRAGQREIERNPALEPGDPARVPVVRNVVWSMRNPQGREKRA